MRYKPRLRIPVFMPPLPTGLQCSELGTKINLSYFASVFFFSRQWEEELTQWPVTRILSLLGNTPGNTSSPLAEHRNMKTSDQSRIVYNSFEQDKKTGLCIVQNTMTNPPLIWIAMFAKHKIVFKLPVVFYQTDLVTENPHL